MRPSERLGGFLDNPVARRLRYHRITAHNHPSGDLEPSENDLDVTKRLVTAGKILGIGLDDHLIVGRSGCLSLRERGAI